MKTEAPWYKRWWINVLLLFGLLLILGLLREKEPLLRFSCTPEQTKEIERLK